MTHPFKVACVQTTSTPRVEESVADACAGLRAAREAGADLLTLPESVNIMDMDKEALLSRVSAPNQDPAVDAFRDTARDLRAWVLVGSVIEKVGERRLVNRSLLIDDQGVIKAEYDKIHMFDVDLEGGESYRESALYEAGDKMVLAETPWGILGLAICYDLRFPHLFRALAKAGAKYLTVPAAFTRPTGRAHWHVLLRARAIECGAYVIAPGQCGDHEGGRKTYGHSLIVDPWGEILADGGEKKGFIAAEINPDRVDEVRGMIPSLIHDREFQM